MATEVKAIVTQIKEKMAEGGLSIYSLEKRAGLKPNAVHNILSGRSKNPTIYILQSIAKALNCTVSDLIGEEPPISSIISATEHSQHSYSFSPQLFQNHELYVKCLFYVSALLNKKNLWLTRERILNYVDEIYLYSAKKSSNKVDAHFANWLLEKEIVSATI